MKDIRNSKNLHFPNGGIVFWDIQKIIAKCKRKKNVFKLSMESKFYMKYSNSMEFKFSMEFINSIESIDFEESHCIEEKVFHLYLLDSVETIQFFQLFTTLHKSHI